ncbi:hypothetical protein FALBO_1828 [Fusarium albosuccineum]|uniref:Uncharacterized protein n=1 Tax=Fusarium albosuccineum TaxID=1237068 RepID=A0A8H4PLT5_9HYPO|nr:hypothetical protein FALBO_1828 [Fusarium albosuccineum]
MSSPQESSSPDKGEAQPKAAVEASPQAEASVPLTQAIPPLVVDGTVILDHINLSSYPDDMIRAALKVILKNFNDVGQSLRPNARPVDVILRDFVGDDIVYFGLKTYKSFDTFNAHFVTTPEFDLLVAIFRGLGHQSKTYISFGPDVVAKAMSFFDTVIDILKVKAAKPANTLWAFILVQAIQQSNHRVKIGIFVLVNHNVVETST